MLKLQTNVPYRLIQLHVPEKGIIDVLSLDLLFQRLQLTRVYNMVKVISVFKHRIHRLNH